jgi:hypothetical protein
MMPQKNNAPIADQFMAGVQRQQRENTQRQTRFEALQAAAQKREAEEAAKERARLQKAFAEYYRDVAPLIDTLEKLPAKNGKEFFVRADLRLMGDTVRSPEKSIDLWLIYTKPVTEGQKAAPCDTYSLYMPMKGSPVNDRIDAAAQDLYLSEHGALHLRMMREDGKTRIVTSRSYEAYDYAPDNRGPGLYRGDYRQMTGTSHEQQHPKLKDVIAAIGAWVNDAAPDRIPEIRAAMDAKQDAQAASQLTQSVSVMRPAAVRKRLHP